MQEATHHPLETRLLVPTTTTSSQFQRFTGSRLEILCDKWRTLTKHGPHTEPFFQPEWVRSYAQAFAGVDEISGVTTMRGDELISILPLHYHKSFFGGVPAHTLRSMSGIHSCRFDLIHGHRQREIAATGTWQVLRDHLSWSVMELLDVPSDGAAHRILELARNDGFLVRTWSTRKMPFMALTPYSPHPFASCPNDSKVYRSRLDSKIRKLKKLGNLTLKSYSSEDRAALQRFISLEGMGWKGQNGSSINRTQGGQTFYEQAAHGAAQHNYLKIYSLELNGEPLSMHFGLLMNGTYYAPKVTYDERFSMYSPGQVLVKLVIEDLSKQGINTYDFLGPRAGWKRIWTSAVREHHNLYIFRPTLFGRALHALTMRAGGIARTFKHQVWGDPQA